MTAPAVTISDWKPLRRNTLQGFFTAHLPSGLTLFEMALHERGGVFWASRWPEDVALSTGLAGGITGTTP